MEDVQLSSRPGCCLQGGLDPGPPRSVPTPCSSILCALPGARLQPRRVLAVVSLRWDVGPLLMCGLQASAPLNWNCSSFIHFVYFLYKSLFE